MKNEWKSVEKSVCEMWMCVCVCAPTDPSIDHFWIRCYYTHINVAVFRTANMLHFSSLLHFHSNLASHCRIRCKTSCKFRRKLKAVYAQNLQLKYMAFHRSFGILVFNTNPMNGCCDISRETNKISNIPKHQPTQSSNQPTDRPSSQSTRLNQCQIKREK